MSRATTRRRLSFAGSLALLGAVAIGGASGCKRGGKGGRPIVQVEVINRSDKDLGRALDLDDARLAAEAVEAIEGLKAGFERRKAGKEEIGWLLEVGVRVVVEGAARPDDAGTAPDDRVFRASGVTLRLQALSSEPGTSERRRLDAEALVGRNLRVFDPIEPLALEAIREAARRVGVRVTLAKAPPDEVVAALADRDVFVKVIAIGVARERRLRQAVPPLIEILKSDESDPEVVAETIGALVHSGDPKAVGPLIDSARRRPPQYLGQILFGVAQIGGKEAEAYLFTVSSGHRNPRVRKDAADALEELQRRKDAASKGPTDD